MSQLIFKFPFKTNYFEEDFYVSENNFEAYKLIESWPKWSCKFINIFGPSGCGKTHLANIFNKKINCFFIKASELNNNTLSSIKVKECLIIDEYKNIHKPNAPAGTKVLLEVGDMLVYSGCELEHWREPFDGDICGQVFLHYNHVNGPFANKNKFDGRPKLGLPSGIK